MLPYFSEQEYYIGNDNLKSLISDQNTLLQIYYLD